MRCQVVNSIDHPVFFKPYQLSRIDDKAHHSRPGFIEFPQGEFTNLAQVKRSEGVLYERMKAQYLKDIDRLRSLSHTLVGDIYNHDINEFYQKIQGGLTGSSQGFSSLVAFRDTRYQLHQLVNRIESFLDCHEHSKPSFAHISRDGLCCLLHECLAGINHCVGGSSSRIRSAFISLEGVRGGVQGRLYKIRHGLLEYAVKVFLANEKKRNPIYRIGNEVHWSNALYNLACDQFGLEPIFDPDADLVRDLVPINQFVSTLPTVMPEREIFDRLTNDYYQQLVSCLKKLNREGWLSRPVAASELDYETTTEIDHDFITPVNLQFQLNENNRLTLWTITQLNDDGTFDLGNSRERFQVWLLKTMLSPKTRVFATVTRYRSPCLQIGSMDNLYFWVFASDHLHRQGDACHFDWDNHQTLTMAHLRKIDFHSWPDDVCLNILHHALKHTRTLDDICQFFLDQTALAAWRTTSQKHPELGDILTDTFTFCMRDSERCVQDLTRHLDSFWDHKQKVTHPILLDLFHLAVVRANFKVVACFCESGFSKLLTSKHAVNIYHALRAAIVAKDSGCFKLLLKQAVTHSCRLRNQKKGSLVGLAARHGQRECLEMLLLMPDMVAAANGENQTPVMEAAHGHGQCLRVLLNFDNSTVNNQNKKGLSALMVAASEGHTECLKLLLAQKRIKVHLTNKEGNSALMLAARNGHGECVVALLEYDSNCINQQNKEGYTALMLAALSGDERCATVLLQQPDLDIHLENKKGETAYELVSENNRSRQPWRPFWITTEAATCGNVDILSEQLKLNPGLINFRNEQGKTLLMLTVTHSRLPCLELLLRQKGIMPDLASKNGMTPMMLAALLGYLDCLKVLLAYGNVDINKRDRLNCTALTCAAKNGHKHCLRLLLAQKGIQVNLQQQDDGFTAIMLAARNGHAECLEALLAYKGTKHEITDIYGWTPLMSAAWYGHANCLEQLLLRSTKKLNKQSKYGNTALMMAAKCGKIACLSTLLAQKGVHINLRNRAGMTALQLAAKYGHVDCLKALLARIRDRCDGGTALMLAAEYGYAACVSALLEHDPKLINAQNKQGYTALMLAAKCGNFACLSILLAQQGVHVNLCNSLGMTALQLAAKYSHVACLKALLARTRDRCDGGTALMLATEYGYADCVSALLEHDSKLINTQNKWGNTALMIAAKNMRNECATVLLQHPDIDVNAKNLAGQTAIELIGRAQSFQPPWKFWAQIITAARQGNLEDLATPLMFSRALLNAPNLKGQTPLMLAALQGHIHCVESLLSDKKSEPDLQSKQGWTAQMYAAVNGRTDCLRALLATGNVDVNKQKKDGFNSLMLVMYNGHAKCLELLLAHKGLNVHLRNQEGNSAVMLAAEKGHSRCLRLLLAFDDRNLNARNRNQWTALMLAAKFGNTECLQLLLAQKNIQAYQTNKDGRTALMVAASYGHVDCVKALLDYDAQIINYQDGDGFTALTLAAMWGHEDCLESLLQQPDIRTNLTLFNGRTASELAAASNHWRCNQLLLEHRASPTIA